MQIKSVKIDAVIVTAGSRSKQPNTVNMVVDNMTAVDVLKFFELHKKGEDPMDGVRAAKLVLEYVEEDGQPVTDKLELTVESGGVVEEDLKGPSDDGE